MSKANYDAAVIALRIRKLAEEHGTPNTFCCSEVFGDDGARWLGKWLRDPRNALAINKNLEPHGLRWVPVTAPGPDGKSVALNVRVEVLS